MPLISEADLKKQLKDGMPRLFMAQVLSDYYKQFPNPADPANATDVAARVSALNSIIDAKATAFGTNGAYLGRMWHDIINNMNSAAASADNGNLGGRSANLINFLNDPKLKQALNQNSALVNLNPALLEDTPAGQAARTALTNDAGTLMQLRDAPTRLNTAFQTAAQTAGLIHYTPVNGGQAESLEGIIAVEDARMRQSRDAEAAAAANGQPVPPSTATPPAPEFNFGAIIMQFFQMIFSFITGMQAPQTQQTADPTTLSFDIPAAIAAASPLRALAGGDGKFDPADITTGDKLNAVLTEMKSELGAKASSIQGLDMNGDGVVDQRDVGKGLEMLTPASTPATASGAAPTTTPSQGR